MIRDEPLRRRVRGEVPNLTKLSGSSGFYRIRVSDYRIGIVVEEDEVVFVRCLHRRDIYRHFPR
jgi:mRNA interferase RelE/StbE